jgi:membrane-bound metal-dependent hydrolase YbcI (DUF457 family)
MAMFRQHITLGAILSTIGVILVLFYSLIIDPLHLGILFALCAFGSVLPDFDSDSGLPFYLTFGAATLAFAGLVLYYTMSGHPQNNYVLVGVPLAALIGFWFIVGGLVKHCTHHRGIWHSLPMLFVASVATYLAAGYFGEPRIVSLMFAGAMGVGFLSHLVLDEVWSEVDHDGNPFTHKRSLGTALKLFSDSRRVNFFTYAILATLIYLSVHSGTIL